MTHPQKLAALRASALTGGMDRRGFLQTASIAGLSMTAASALWTEARAATPQKGGALRAGADGGSASDTLDPLQATGADHVTIAALSCYDTLTEMDANGAPQPSLAESWEGAPDGTWAFKIRRGVEFHDGAPLTAEDVVWSLRLQLDENNKFAEGKQIVENFEELRADGPDTVIIKQRQVNFDLPAHLSSFGLLIGKRGRPTGIRGQRHRALHARGLRAGHVRFAGRKFANFYRDDQGHFDEVEVLNVADPNARASAIALRARST
jgi:peptide/nickel transport system substrate-binding protein